MDKTAKILLPPQDNLGVLVCKNITPVDVLRLATNFEVKQIVQESNPKVDEEWHTSLLMLKASDLYFNFPLSSVLCPAAIHSVKIERELRLASIEFYSSTQKDQVLERLLATVETVSSRRSLIEDVRLVADELFSNCIYNAPFVTAGVKIDRRRRIDLDPLRPARLTIGADGDRLVVVCEDQFGSLEINRFLDKIKKCYEMGRAKMINLGEGGAGIGSHLIFDSCASLFCGVRKGSRTTFACVFPTKSAYRNLKESSKNIHVIDG